MEILIKKKKDTWNYVHEIKHYLFMPKYRNALRYGTGGGGGGTNALRYVTGGGGGY